MCTRSILISTYRLHPSLHCNEWNPRTAHCGCVRAVIKTVFLAVSSVITTPTCYQTLHRASWAVSYRSVYCTGCPPRQHPVGSVSAGVMVSSSCLCLLEHMSAVRNNIVAGHKGNWSLGFLNFSTQYLYCTSTICRRI